MKMVRPNVFTVEHPVVKHKVTMLREKGTQPWLVRMLVKEVSTMIAYEAIQDLSTEAKNIDTPDTPIIGTRIKQKIGILPVMRAGDGMLNGVLELLSEAEVWHIGVEGGHGAHRAYYNKLTTSMNPPTFDYGLVLDPILKTGNSAKYAIQTLHDLNITKIKFLGIVGTDAALDMLFGEFPDIKVYLASIEQVDDRNWIPGWGDAGDRQFNTI
ncbi:MAG: uracil phosphoribosyltransferase [Anaerolineaceae bacterium]|nr:uracil phosphoribosyltransferase [Anaerolineaceae bacterium]